jgi:hypothetical protein
MRKKRKKRPQAGPRTPPQPGLNEAGRAQLGADEERRRYRPREADASVEDPLKDWPEEE